MKKFEEIIKNKFIMEDVVRMSKIADSFNGYLKIGNDTFAYNVSNHIVTLLPAQSMQNERYEAFDRVCSRNEDLSEYLFGNDNNKMIAMLRNSKYNTSVFGFNPSIRFTTPIIIRAAGNASGFFDMLTQDWDKFHAITFWGGNINALYNPQRAVEQQKLEECIKNNGAREIKIRPYKDYTHSIDFSIDDEKVTLTVSIGQNGGSASTEHMGAYSLGELNSFMRFSFENAQCFEKIEKYYKIAKSLIAILSMRNNVFFEVYLSQRNLNNEYFKTADCKIFDRYENYSKRKYHNVIPIYNVFDYIPNLIEKIVNNEVESMLVLLPEDNRRVNQISITNIQDLCTALEVAYHWSNWHKEKDGLVEELKKKIKTTIDEFTKTHNEIDIYRETTISSAFQYLDYTLRQKILAMYNENCDVIDAVISKWSLPKINEDNVKSFVKLRNNKTHSGIIEWGDSADLYTALLALVYTCLFKYIKLPDEIIKLAILQIF